MHIISKVKVTPTFDVEDAARPIDFLPKVRLTMMRNPEPSRENKMLSDMPSHTDYRMAKLLVSNLRLVSITVYWIYA